MRGWSFGFPEIEAFSGSIDATIFCLMDQYSGFSLTSGKKNMVNQMELQTVKESGSKLHNLGFRQKVPFVICNPVDGHREAADIIFRSLGSITRQSLNERKQVKEGTSLKRGRFCEGLRQGSGQTLDTNKQLASGFLWIGIHL